MSSIVKKLTAFLISVSLITCGIPLSSFSREFPERGEETAAKAARFTAKPPDTSPEVARVLNSFASQPDSAASVQYEEEEERNLVKEIIVWTVGAAFVGYFIVKVFLQGDTEEPPPQKPGKEIPNGSVSGLDRSNSSWKTP